MFSSTVSSVATAEVTNVLSISPALIRLCVFCATAGMLFGYDTGVVSVAIIKMQDDFSSFDALRKEWFVSITTLGAAVGSVISATLNHDIGRKPVLVLAAILYLTGTLVVVTTSEYAILLLGRAFLGIAIGFSSATVPMYASELAPKSMRGTIVVLHDFSVVLGQLLACLLNGGFYMLSEGWRFSIGFACLPALVMLLLLFFLPESPRWLLGVGRSEAAEAAFYAVYARPARATQRGRATGAEGAATQAESPTGGRTRTRIPSGEDFTSAAVAAEMAALREVVEVDKVAGNGLHAAAHGGGLYALWTEPQLRRAALLGMLVMALNQLTGINTIMYYSATIFKDLVDVQLAVWLAAVCAAVQLIGVVISMCTIDSQGRRTTALRSVILVFIALTAIAIFYATCPVELRAAPPSLPPIAQTARPPTVPPSGLPPAPPPGLPPPPFPPPVRSRSTFCASATITLVMLYLIAYGSGLSGVASVVASEIYPLRVRATGIGQAVFVNWLTNYAVAQSFLSMVEVIGEGGTFAVYAGVSFVGGLLLYRYLPETAGLTLEEVETLFQDPYPSNTGDLTCACWRSSGTGSSASDPPKMETTTLLADPANGGKSPADYGGKEGR